jgi:Zn-dependent metalloprotease
MRNPPPRPTPLHCVIPPYVLQQIALNGSAKQRRSALTTFLLDDSVRSARAASQGTVGASLFSARTPGRRRAVAAPQRTVCDAHNTQSLPGEEVRLEGDDATGDPAVDEAYDGLGATYDLFSEVYARDSIDGAGLPLLATVHYDVDYDNAFWDGAQMVFGDGDGELFNRFTISLDVIGHELAHGLTEAESGLIYWAQSGALNESLSDVFGSLVKQYSLSQQTDQADWLIGAGLFTNAVNGVALRSMEAPGTAYDDPVLGRDPQPAHMSDYVATSSDNGGVHINSGIPNHAFYLAATTLGGYAWEHVGWVWYQALLSPRMRERMGFREFAALTCQVAIQTYGFGSDEARAVRQAWTSVGLPVGPPAPRLRGAGRVAAASCVGPGAVLSSELSPWAPGAPSAADAADAGQAVGSASTRPSGSSTRTAKKAASKQARKS